MIANIHEARFCVNHLAAMIKESAAVNARHRLERYHNSEKFLQKLPQGGATTMIIEALKKHGPKMTSSEIAKVTDRKATTTLSALTRMQRKGLVKHGSERPALWHLTPAGEAHG